MGPDFYFRVNFPEVEPKLIDRMLFVSAVGTNAMFLVWLFLSHVSFSLNQKKEREENVTIKMFDKVIRREKWPLNVERSDSLRGNVHNLDCRRLILPWLPKDYDGIATSPWKLSKTMFSFNGAG